MLHHGNMQLQNSHQVHVKLSPQGLHSCPTDTNNSP